MCPDRHRVRIGTALLLVGLAAGAQAAETELLPSAALRQEYTDNLFYSATAPRETFITHVTPGFRATVRSERFDSSLSARLNFLHYSVDSHLDNVEQFYEGNGAYRLTPRLSLSASGGYRRESWPDREIESSGLAQNLSSKHYLSGAGAEYVLAEGTLASLSYGYDQVDYDNPTRASNVATHTVSAGVEHDAGRLLPLLKLRSGVRYSRSDYDTARVENYVATLGGSWKLHELWALSADAGGRYTSSRFQVLTFDPLAGFGLGQETSATTGWVANSSLDYQGETCSGSLAYSRDVSSTTGRQGTSIERNALLFSLRRKLTYELSAATGGGYYRNSAGRNQFGSGEINETSWRGYASLRYEYSRDVTAELGYDFTRLENNVSGSTADRNKLFLQVTFQTRLFENGWH